MSRSQTLAYPQKIVPAATVVSAYSVPPTNTTLVKSMVFYNQHSSSVELRIFLSPGGGAPTQRLLRRTLASDETLVLQWGLVMEAGGIELYASVANVVSYVISGAELQK